MQNKKETYIPLIPRAPLPTIEMVLVLQVTMPQCGGYFQPITPATALDCIEEIRVLLEEGDAGDSITFSLIKMTQADIDSAPEFTGW